MPAYRKLPEQEELRRLAITEGLNNQEIGKLYSVSGEAVRQALVQAGIERPNHEAPISHGHYIPWKIRADHTSDVLARRLRSYSKMKQRKPLSDTEKRLLDAFLVFMDGENPDGIPQSVHYDRYEGWWLEPRQPGDRDYIHLPTKVG